MTKRLPFFLTCVLVLLVASASYAQDARNPSSVEFGLSIDHDQVTGYEVDLVDDDTSAVIATIDLGKPAGSAGDRVTVAINVQPISFGHYRGVFRAMFDDGGVPIASDDVPSANEFDRVPGGPSSPEFR